MNFLGIIHENPLEWYSFWGLFKRGAFGQPGNHCIFSAGHTKIKGKGTGKL
jgi:hypothetical protein